MPHLDLHKEAAAVKGSPLTDDEIKALDERAAYARFWLETYAPEQHRFVLQQSVPEGLELSGPQKTALSAIHSFISEGERSGEELHNRLHELKTEVPIEPKELFSAIYQVFLARTSGPKAGWFLSVLPRDYVLALLAEATV
jgi:lysyl-tRNA synthetase class 1